MTRLLRLLSLIGRELGNLNDRLSDHDSRREAGWRYKLVDRIAASLYVLGDRVEEPRTVSYDSMQRLNGEWWVCARTEGGEWELRRATPEEAQLVLDAFAQAGDELAALRERRS